MAAIDMFATLNVIPDVVPCAVSADVVTKVLSGDVDGAVLPIENSLHGSVAEHYDLLLSEPVRIVRESSMRVRHNVIVLKGVSLRGVRTVISHPVALSQCRRWQREHPEIVAMPFYDTAGSVKHIVEGGMRDVAALAPALAAEVYGAEVLIEGVEDHAENFTRFHLVVQDGGESHLQGGKADKMSIAFAVEHRPGTLVAALEGLARVGADLTKIESRPVPGRPWEYVFYVDLRFAEEQIADAALESLRSCSGMVKELGRYVSAVHG